MSDTLNLEGIYRFLEDQKKLLVYIFICHKNLKRLIEDKYEYESKIKKHGFFQHYDLLLKMSLCIQLSKLYKDTDKRSFTKFCNKLDSSKYTPLFKELLLSNPQMNKEVESLTQNGKELVGDVRRQLIDNNKLINELLIARDKFYAHLDPNRPSFALSFEELTSLVENAGEIYNKFSRLFHQTTFAFSRVKDWDVGDILLGLSNLEVMREEKRNQKLRDA